MYEHNTKKGLSISIRSKKKHNNGTYDIDQDLQVTKKINKLSNCGYFLCISFIEITGLCDRVNPHASKMFLHNGCNETSNRRNQIKFHSCKYVFVTVMQAFDWWEKYVNRMNKKEQKEKKKERSKSCIALQEETIPQINPSPKLVQEARNQTEKIAPNPSQKITPAPYTNTTQIDFLRFYTARRYGEGG